MPTHQLKRPPIRVVMMTIVVLLLSSTLQPDAVRAAGGLTINVLNQHGQPAQGRPWVGVYEAPDHFQFMSDFMVNGTASFPDLKPGTYTVIVFSGADRFFLQTAVDVTTNTVLNLDARVGTIPVTLKGVGRDGTILQNAVFSLLPQSVPYIFGDFGTSEPDGNLPLLVTPGVYTVALEDTERLLRLDLAAQDLTKPTTVVINEAAIPTGRLRMTIQGDAQSTIYINRAPFTTILLPITNGSTLVASVGSLPVGVALFKTDARDEATWNINIQPKGSPFNIALGTEATFSAGGALKGAVFADAKAARGELALIASQYRDAFDNPLDGLGSPPNSLADLTVTDSVSQVIYQRHINLYDDVLTFAVPMTATLGTAKATISIDTGPFQGVLTATTTFDIAATINRQCFDQTSQCAQGTILDYWNRNGGLPVFGYPLTAARIEYTLDGTYLTELFERNRLELHPENAAPYNVLLGRLGADLLDWQGRPWDTLPREDPKPDCTFFPETRHNLCEPFRTYWREHGLDLGDPGISERESLALFGLPVTTPAMEENSSGDTVLTQWFERARFEHHPQNEPPFNVLLGRLGAESQ